MMGLPSGKRISMIHSAVLTLNRIASDRLTDGRNCYTNIKIACERTMRQASVLNVCFLKGLLLRTCKYTFQHVQYVLSKTMCVYQALASGHRATVYVRVLSEICMQSTQRGVYEQSHITPNIDNDG